MDRAVTGSGVGAGAASGWPVWVAVGGKLVPVPVSGLYRLVFCSLSLRIEYEIVHKLLQS